VTHAGGAGVSLGINVELVVNRLSTFAVSVFAAALSGCATIGTLQTAETNGAGQFQGAIEPAFFGSAGSNGSGGFGYFNVSGRYGVNDRVDIGGRLGTSGLELTTKFMLTDPNDSRATQVSIAPSGGGIFFALGGAGGGIFNFQIPLIVGIPVGRHQLVVAPKLHTLFAGGGSGGESAGVFVGSLGSSIGFAAKVAPSVRLMPEFAFVVPVVGGAAASGQGSEVVSGFADGVLFQASIGILFGGRKVTDE
jgi:hypothetical protein